MCRKIIIVPLGIVLLSLILSCIMVMMMSLTSLAFAESAQESTAYQWPIIKITNTQDNQWKTIDTVKAIYVEPTHTTVLYLSGVYQQFAPPFVVKEIQPGGEHGE